MIYDENDPRTPITLEIYQLLPEYLRKEQPCRQCGANFKESENIGRLLCRIHPGIRLIPKGRGSIDAFYSCCGQFVSNGGRERGCLQWDHHCEKFSESDGNIRLSQIQEAASIIVPHIFMRFITPPLQINRVYDTNINGTSKCRFFTLGLPALEFVAKRNALLLSSGHKPMIVYMDNMDDDCAGNGMLMDPSDFSNKEFDLEQESRLLWKEGRDSPFFTRFLPKSSECDRVIQSKCDSVWQTQLAIATDVFGRKNDDEDDECDYQQVSFIIINRIHSRIEELPSRK